MQDTEKDKPMGALKIEPDAFRFIEFRDEKWRFKGQRANVIDAIVGMKARQESVETLARDLDVSIDAVIEAVHFVDSHPEAVADHHRRMLKFANEHSRR